MELWILALTAVFLGKLVWEARQARLDRSRLEHVVHVNGTRGKSTTSRLIEAGLRAGGWKVFCKTTGTDPITIEVDDSERPIRRVGPSNIREQLKIMHRAVSQGAQVLVVECMAVQPELQYTAQHKMLRADIGVITNVRIDHTDVMGETLPEICRALCNTVPEKGVLFTAETQVTDQMGEFARKMGTRFVPVRPDGTEPDFDFPDNIALALAVCQELGVDRQTALEGMRRFHPDPYALAIYRLGEGIFVNGLSINDIQSTQMVYHQVLDGLDEPVERKILLFNNRMDRGSRTRDMVKTALLLQPDEVWLLGAGKDYFVRNLKAGGFAGPVVKMRGGNDPRLSSVPRGWMVFAAGNIAKDGKVLMANVKRKGERLV